jgi:hypothetical protein
VYCCKYALKSHTCISTCTYYAIAQVERTKVDGMTPEEASALLESHELPFRIYLRDLDAYMHLVRLKRHEENLSQLYVEQHHSPAPPSALATP